MILRPAAEHRQAVLNQHRLAAYLVAEAVSAIGSWALIIALWGVAAYRFDVGPLGVTLVGLSWIVPSVLLGPAVGVLIDRHGARRVLVVSDLAAAAGSLAITLAWSFPSLVALSVVHGVAWAAVQPAIMALPPRVVASEQLARTNALLRMTNSLAIMVGPAVGGAAIAAWGFSAAFVVDAGSYLVGAAGALLLRPSHGKFATAAVEPPDQREKRWRDALAGLQVARATAQVRRVLTLNASIYLLYGASLVYEPLYVKDVLSRPPSTFAQLQSAFGVVLTLTGLLVVRFAERFADLRKLAWAVVASGLCAALYLGTPSVTVAFVGVLAWGAAAALVGAPASTLLQRSTPMEVHGRIMALDRSVEGLTKLVALLAAGAGAAVLGVRGAAVTVAGLTCAVGLTVWARCATSPASAASAADQVRADQVRADTGDTSTSSAALHQASAAR